MTRLQKTTSGHMQLGTGGVRDSHTPRAIAKVKFFIRKLMQMLLAMGAGMALFYLLILLIRASSSYATMFEPGTDLYTIGMAVFMTVPTWVVSQCGDGNRNARANNG